MAMMITLVSSEKHLCSRQAVFPLEVANLLKVKFVCGFGIKILKKNTETEHFATDKSFATEMLHFSVLKWLFSLWYLISTKSEWCNRKLCLTEKAYVHVMSFTFET